IRACSEGNPRFAENIKSIMEKIMPFKAGTTNDADGGVGTSGSGRGLLILRGQPVQERSLVLVSDVSKPDDQQDSVRQY
ncbi:MAG TPA: hypothetical protein VNY06_05125, partial [Methylocella sp.]|nr:hypothetical protein [Methylocella sp.]